MDYTKADLMTQKEMMDEIVELNAKLIVKTRESDMHRSAAFDNAEEYYKMKRERDEAQQQIEVRDRVIANHHSETLRLIHNRDEAWAHYIVLNDRAKNLLELVESGVDCYEYIAGEQCNFLGNAVNPESMEVIELQEALSETPSDSTLKVRKLIGALEEAQQIVSSTEFPTVAKMIDDALAEWRVEK